MLWNQIHDQPKVLDEVGEGLLKAAKYIEDHGWCQCQLYDCEGRVCLNGAMWMSIVKGDKKAYYTGTDRQLYERMGARVDRLQPDRVLWNNNPDRTKQEVIDVLKQSAYL